MSISIALGVQPLTLSTAVEQSAAEGVPSCFVSWTSVVSGDDNQANNEHHIHGSVIGCDDGSVFVFQTSRHQTRRNLRLSPPADLGEAMSRASSPFRHSGLSVRSARSTSPSSTIAAFSPMQVSKSRVVSGVSAEQVEAPKNYVDFDEEPERLKGMLKGRGIKDKSVVDASEKLGAPLPSAPPAEKPSSNRTNLSKTLASEASSARSSLSSPSLGPAVVAANENPRTISLSLICHVFPLSRASNQAVMAMQAVHHGHFVVCLHENGNIELLSTEDGWCLASHVPDIGHDGTPHSKVPIVWIWKTLQVAAAGEYQILLAAASPLVTSSNVLVSDSADGDSEDQTRIIALEFKMPQRSMSQPTSFNRIGDWLVNGPAEGVTLHVSPDGLLEILHVTSPGHFIRRDLVIHEYPMTADIETSKSQSSIHLAIPNPFKALAARSTDDLAGESKDEEISAFDRAQLGEDVDFGALPLHGCIRGVRMIPTVFGIKGLVWSDDELSGFECRGSSLKNLFSCPVNGVIEVRWKDKNTYIVVFLDHAEEHSLIDVDADNNALVDVPGSSGPHNIQPILVHSATLLSSDSCTVTSAGAILTTRVKKGRRRIEYTPISPTDGNGTSYTVWLDSENLKLAQESTPRISAVLPLELEHVIVGLADGHICRSSLSQLIQRRARESAPEISDIPAGGRITSLHLVQDSRTADNLVIGGSDDGGIAIWNLKSLRLAVRWTVFTVPLAQVIFLSEGRLRGCAFCISQDGTVAVIAVDEFQFLFLVPASIARLIKICLGEDNLLIYYADGRARLWDIKTREHWRTMNSEKADEMVKGGGWQEWEFGGAIPGTSRVLSPLSGINHSPDAAATILVNTEELLVQLGLSAGPSGTKTSATDSTDTLANKADQIRTVLSPLLAAGLNEAIDRMCHDSLMIPPSPPSLGFSALDSTSLYPCTHPQMPWCISADVSAAQALHIVSLVHALSQCIGSSTDVDTVIAFYTASLPAIIGDQYKAPNLSFLAREWLRTAVNAVRQASRELFDSEMTRLTDEETTDLVELWQADLPTLQAADKDSMRCAIALFICGSIAVRSYTLLSTSYLTEIAKSIALYLHDESSPYRALAIDLCSRGFPVWQQYVDAVQMLRALFTLATSTRKEAISVQNVGQLARTAILQIASSNTPLFMTTLSIDILNPGSMQHRKSVMQLVIFLIRKKPLVLYSNLPRLVEAVVKSLDPNSSANRDAILDSATEILGHIVQSFPTVDFHMASQRLAVGTSEGSVVMYDLKTATRLYVLEGHKKRTTACSFSPDGRRLVTVSLDECAVLVWKVGSSFSSFFNPGAPPRQGHGGSEPFKTLNFNIGDESKMSLEATLELVRFDWPSERSVKLTIRESVLTFST